MKKLMSVLMAMTLLFTAAGCANRQSSQNVSAQSTSSSGGVKVDENLLTVEITIPAGIAGENPSATLTEEQKQNGFKEGMVNADGSVTYKIVKGKYKSYLASLRAETKATIESLNADGTYKSIKKIECNGNISKVIITAERSAFESGLDSLSMLGVGIAGMLYQTFDKESGGKVTIEVKDASSGEVFKTVVYPDAFNQE